MNLKEALDTIAKAKTVVRRPTVYLACGFTPVHLQTFLRAELIAANHGNDVECRVGPYGDLMEALNAVPTDVDAVAVAVEWRDLDPRLGFRRAGGWGSAIAHDLVTSAERRMRALAAGLEAVAARAPVAMAPPGLPMAPRV